MKGGYILVQAGVDLTKTGATTQTISGLYAKLTAAMNTGKLIICQGFTMGSGKPLTPVVISPYVNSGAITFKYNMDTIAVSSSNVVTITPYTPPEG